MRPIKFPDANASLSRPAGTAKDDCGLLPIHRTDDGRIVTCWKLTDDDLKIIFETKQIWVQVMDSTMPPICLHTDNPFRSQP